MTSRLALRGHLPAPILPFSEDYRIDEAELRGYTRFLLSSRGLGGIVPNGHAGEVSLLSRDERRRVLDITIEEVGGRVPVVAGVVAESTWESIQYARDAREAGADAILVFPPNGFRGGASSDPDVPLGYFSSIADAVDIPIVVFQFPLATGLWYPPEVLARLCEIDSVVAVKDGIGDLERYEDDLRAIRNAGREISVLSSNNTLLVPSFVIGADGVLSGLGALAPNLIADGFDAVRAGDMARARSINDSLYPITRAIYRYPYSYWHIRIKEALAMIGQLTRAVVRPPLVGLPEEDRPALRQALGRSGLL
jgi:4-hydroxy-tetrahydrodipicolinate synthase